MNLHLLRATYNFPSFICCSWCRIKQILGVIDNLKTSPPRNKSFLLLSSHINIEFGNPPSFYFIFHILKLKIKAWRMQNNYSSQTFSAPILFQLYPPVSKKHWGIAKRIYFQTIAKCQTI